jgi:hypothetical protein
MSSAALTLRQTRHGSNGSPALRFDVMTEPGRTRWTDDRMDDLAGEVRELRVEMREEFRALRAEMREGFQIVREEMRGLRSETKEEIRELREGTGEESRALRAELYSTRRWTVNLWATTVLGFVALFVQASLR